MEAETGWTRTIIGLVKVDSATADVMAASVVVVVVVTVMRVMNWIMVGIVAPGQETGGRG